MQDMEPFDHSDRRRDDPWDNDPTPRQAAPEEKADAPDAPIDACETVGASAPASKRLIHMPTALITLAVCLIAVGAFSALRAYQQKDAASSSGSIYSSQNNSREDNFVKDVDPDGSSEASASEDSSGTTPSEIFLYTGDASFSMMLQSCEGRDVMTKQEVYAKVMPSVVTVTVYSDSSGAYATGIVLSEDGFILTNQHVVGGESRAQVTTDDEQTYEALLVGEDPNTDLAVLKIDATGLTPAEFGRSDELLVGDDCYAIGNPLGITYRGTFTNGIISALNRNVSLNGYTMTLIQTTAALNSGNSGGPLINSYGQVIGVNNMKIMSSSTTVEGLGFAIPSSTVQEVANALISDGTIEHPVIGITCYGVTANDEYAVSGVCIATVSAGSDAEAKGLEVGDIITAVNGIPCSTVSDVGAQMKGLGVGDSISLTVWHDGTESTVDVALVEQNNLS